MSDQFDFDAFMKNALTPDEETTREHLRDAVSDSMEASMNEVAPRIWAVLLREMQKDPQSNVHLNATLNSALCAIFAWIAACSPEGETNGRDNGDVLRERVRVNLDTALASCRTKEKAQELSMMASTVGVIKLLQDSHVLTADAIQANSKVILALNEMLSKRRD